MRRFKKIIWLLAVLVIASAAVFIIAEKDKGENLHDVSLYFLEKDSISLLKTETSVFAENTDELIEKTVKELVKGPKSKKYSPIMNKSVKVNEIKREGSSVTVDFSEEYDTGNLECTYAVIKSLSGIEGIDRVRVTVCGTDATQYGFISGSDISVEPNEEKGTGIGVYFANSDKTGLVREYRRINVTDTQPVEQYIIAELLKGPKNDKNVKLLASDTGVLSVETTEGTCYVNFKKDFIDKNALSQEVDTLTIYSVVNSLTEREDVKNVQFLIEGKKTDLFGNLNISELFYRNEDLNK